MTIKVLIVDDVLFARKSLCELLTGQGWEVVGEASNGQEAIEQYLSLKPDVVTMDLTMPVLDGIAAIEGIIDHDPRAKIVVCSMNGQPDVIYKAIQAGARDFVLKPYQKERIVSAVEKAATAR